MREDRAVGESGLQRRQWRSRLGTARQDLSDRAANLLDALRRRRVASSDLGRGVAFAGTIWPGGDAMPFTGVVLVSGRGIIGYLGPLTSSVVPGDLPLLGGPGYWVGPGVVDAHVHLAYTSPAACLSGGVVGVRDLGAPPALARQWRTGHRPPPPDHPFVAVAGPVLTAPRGYPSRSWGRDGFAAFISSPGQARQVVHRIAAGGADVVKIALEPGDTGWPVPGPGVVRAVVEAAHATGLAVVAHALTADMVGRAVDAGVDELAHTPTERLPEALIERLAGAGISVVSTLQTFFSAGSGRDAAANASALHREGVRLRYGTDLGNDGTRAGVDPRELDRLADTGLGRRGALRAATEWSAQAPGMRRRTGRLQVHAPAALVLLPADPWQEPGAWRTPTAVLADGRLHVG
jgi:imidazolonepropionase-like amidohydrolase